MTRIQSFNQVYVWLEGESEKLVVEGGPGSKDLDRIWPNVTYEFRTYAGKDHKKLLATLKVCQE